MNHQFVFNLMVRLWRDFGPGSPIEHIEVVFFAPEPSEKIWYYSVCKKAQMKNDEIWERGVVVDVRKEAADYDPRSFDPFRPIYGPPPRPPAPLRTTVMLKRTVYIAYKH
jgi:hypothetical protein